MNDVACRTWSGNGQEALKVRVYEDGSLSFTVFEDVTRASTAIRIPLGPEARKEISDFLRTGE